MKTLIWELIFLQIIELHILQFLSLLLFNSAMILPYTVLSSHEKQAYFQIACEMLEIFDKLHPEICKHFALIYDNPWYTPFDLVEPV